MLENKSDYSRDEEFYDVTIALENSCQM